ncbi:hypothetical protein E2542_SST26165 [Spatholobus suberectus]|nr:hypothetical protein E2542_SST26165 [Spatholobus suberectus]
MKPQENEALSVAAELPHTLGEQLQRIDAVGFVWQRHCEVTDDDFLAKPDQPSLTTSTSTSNPAPSPASATLASAPDLTASATRSPSTALPRPPPLPDADQPQAAEAGFPFFVARIYGPRCPQRKKLMAAKSVLFVPVSPAADSPDLVIDALGADLLVAN